MGSKSESPSAHDVYVGYNTYATSSCRRFTSLSSNAHLPGRPARGLVANGVNACRASVSVMIIEENKKRLHLSAHISTSLPSHQARTDPPHRAPQR